ncbi:MAG: glycosyltransferase family 2 protein [Chloroflexota bacterium]
MKIADQPTSPAANQLDISIVMPCLNEEDGVAECVGKALDWISRAGMRGEVIVVDNNSTDRSAEIAAAAGARVIPEKEPGYGAALRRGFREARGKYMVMGDCDGTYEFSQLDPLVGPLGEGYDLVMGNRLTDQLEHGAMPWAHRVIGTPMISWMLRLFTGAKITDSQCGIRAMRRDSIQALGLRTPGMEFASEMILKAMQHNLKLTEVPVPYNVRVGEAKLSTIRDGWRHLRFLLISSPSYAFLAPGFLSLLLGLICLVITVAATSGVSIFGFDWQPVFAASIFFVIGINAVMLGLLAKLLAVRTGDIESRLVTFYHNYLGLEHMMAISLAMFVSGILIDTGVLIAWLNDSSVDLIPWTALAQSLILIGANLLLGAFAAAMVEDYATPPEFVSVDD